MRVLPILLTFIFSNVVHALEIDEKLTIRFLKVSNSKKTVLINRGSEDGLVVGDHAKYFITSGVIARGVVEKVSPSRSIWSLYRVVDPSEITDGKVLNLKISSPVKITADPSKSMKEEEIPGGSEKMSLTDGEPESVKENAPATADEKKELEGMGIEDKEEVKKSPSATPAKNSSDKKSVPKEVVYEEAPSMGSNTSKNWELWGTLYVNSLTGTIDNPSSTTASTGTSASGIDFSLGIERYFLNAASFVSNISGLLFVHKRGTENNLLISTGVKNTSDWLEFGGGVNYHFYNHPASLGRLIGFVNLSGGAGSATIKDSTTSGATETVSSTKGTNTFVIGGVGAKYILSNGFGARMNFDYYSGKESYSIAQTTGDPLVTTRTLAGPRIQFGLSYRF